MKKIIILTLVAIIASSCSVLTGQSPAAPQVDTQATIDAMVKQAAAETLAAQPSPTTAPPTNTETPVVESSTSTPAATSDSPTSSPIPNLTTTPVTATPGTEVPTNTADATQAVTSPGAPTLTPTLGVLTYGTLPPKVPFTSIKIFNKSKTEAYISLQNDCPDPR